MKDLIKILNDNSYTSIGYHGSLLTIALSEGDFYNITLDVYKEPGDRCDITGETEGSCSVDVSEVAYWDNVRDHYYIVDIDNFEELNQLLENEYHTEF